MATEPEKMMSLRNRAIALVDQAKPSDGQAVSLRLLASLADGDLGMLSQGGLSPERRNELADALHVDIVVVNEALRRFVVRDLRHQEDLSHAAPNKLLPTFVPPRREPAEFWYSLHTSTMRWVPAEELLDVVMLRDEGESVDCQAYLLAAKRAYATTVGLLEASYSENWPKWQLLWKYY